MNFEDGGWWVDNRQESVHVLAMHLINTSRAHRLLLVGLLNCCILVGLFLPHLNSLYFRPLNKTSFGCTMGSEIIYQ